MSMLKDPAAVLDFSVDWSDWLAASETISSYTVTVPTGITKASDAQAAGVVTFWLTGGTVGSAYPCVVHITSNQGRQDDRTVTIVVRDR